MLEKQNKGNKSLAIFGCVVVASVGAWCLATGSSPPADHDQPAREYINRQGYKPVLRARQAPTQVPGNSTGSEAGQTTGGSGSVITLSYVLEL